LSGGPEEHVSRQGRYLSADGTTRFHSKSYFGPIFSMPLAGGEEHLLIPETDYKAWFLAADGIYYIGRENKQGEHPLSFYSFSSRSSRVLTTFKGRVVQGLTVSPDGKSILFAASAASGSDLMLIENFR
jgi:hypothetical protein